LQLALANVVTADELREQIDRLSEQIAKLNKN
jgi:polyhydroxyalkanoate synthesis regulator phasin